MIGILKNNWYRIVSRKNYLLISVLLTVFSVSLAIYFTSQFQVKGNIALVTQSGAAPVHSQSINITAVKTAPPLSDLVLNKYDAIVVDNGSGNYSIQTIKNEKDKAMFLSALQNPASFHPAADDERGAGTNILGFLIMFVLIEGVLYMMLFAEDREKRLAERIATSPVSFYRYLLSHCLFVFLILYLPTYAVIAAAKLIGFRVGFTLVQYALLLAVLCALSVAFSLFINSLFKVAETANQLGSSLVTLTTILAGSFYSFSKENTVFDAMIRILPQKDFISFTQALENGKLTSAANMQIGYVIVLTAAFFFFSILLNKRDYIYSKD
jgi:ABC-2 type transport system permease protein